VQSVSSLTIDCSSPPKVTNANIGSFACAPSTQISLATEGYTNLPIQKFTACCRFNRMLAEITVTVGSFSYYKVRVVTPDPGDATTFMPPGSDPITT
jgi:hypothetical protein